MLNSIKKELKKPLLEIGVLIDEITYENKKLTIIIDSKKTLDLDLCVEATNVINPILDKKDPIEEEYELEVMTKVKGEEDGQ